jgi:hypothetical protein
MKFKKKTARSLWDWREISSGAEKDELPHG